MHSLAKSDQGTAETAQSLRLMPVADLGTSPDLTQMLSQPGLRRIQQLHNLKKSPNQLHQLLSRVGLSKIETDLLLHSVSTEIDW